MEEYIWVRTDSRNYYVKDHLGSIRQTLNTSGVVMSAMDYYAFGSTLSSYVNGNTVDKYKFTGKERDLETGLDYFGARYYDSRICRWMSVDPLAEKYPGWSPYNYSANNPLNYFDPDGKAYRDSKGRNMTYSINGGKISFSKNATKDFKRIATALSKTESGRKQLDAGRDLSQNIVYKINNDIKRNDEGKMEYGTATHTYGIQNGEVKVTETKVDINLGSVVAGVIDPNGSKFTGLTTEQALAAVAGHEVKHGEQAKQEIEEENGGKAIDEEKEPRKVEQQIINESRNN